MRAKKKITAVLLAAVLVLAVGGCGPQAERGKFRKVSVLLDWTPNTNHTGVYAAKKLGYYEKEGLDVEIVQPATGGTAQLIAAGQGDFGFSYQEEVTIARTKNLPIKAIAAVIQHNTSGFASPVEKNIRTPKDFEGKTYGGWGSPAEEAMLKALMKQENADFGKVKIVNIGTADFFASIERDIDFAWIFWGWTGIESELRGIKLNFIPLRQYHDALDFYSPVLIASEKTIADDPELVKKFMKATSKGYEYCMRHPEKAAAILLQEVPELNRDLVVASQRYLAKEYKADAAEWGEMSCDRWKKYADWMYAQGLLERPLDCNKAFTNEFLPGGN